MVALIVRFDALLRIAFAVASFLLTTAKSQSPLGINTHKDLNELRDIESALFSGDECSVNRTDEQYGHCAVQALQLHAMQQQTVYADKAHHYDASWKTLIAGSSCHAEVRLKLKGGGHGGVLTCRLLRGGRHFKFPSGEFDIDEQVVVPGGTVIEGNANPNEHLDKTKKPNHWIQTYFVATRGVTNPNTPYCGTNLNMQPGEAQRLRIGFLLHSNTVVKNINFQGKDTTRPWDNGNLCGGAAFEMPGCVSPGWGNGPGYGWEGKRRGCYDHNGKWNDLITGHGKGVENVVIENVRLNDLLGGGQGTQLAVWIPMTKDGSATKNVKVTNLVSMLTRGDGINFHGNVQNSLVEGCHIENTGDDIYAFWGGYAANPSGNVFRNNVGKNPGAMRNYGYGVCFAVYGASDLTIHGNQCYDKRHWNHKCKYGPFCNSCLAYVHDGSFGAIYPAGNRIKIYANEYMYMDAPWEHIKDRPMIRTHRSSKAHVLTTL